MRCFGVTKRIKRCNNKCKYLFCKTHLYQFIMLVISIVTAISWNLLSNFIYDLSQDNKQLIKETISLQTIQVDVPLLLFTLKDEYEIVNDFICLYLDGSGVFLVLIDNKNEYALDNAVSWSGGDISNENINNYYTAFYFYNTVSIACFLCTPGYRTLYHKIGIIEDESFVRNNMLHLKIEIKSPLDISINKKEIPVSTPLVALHELIENNYLDYYGENKNDINYISLKNCPYFMYFNSSYKYRYCLAEVKHEYPILIYNYAGNE